MHLPFGQLRIQDSSRIVEVKNILDRHLATVSYTHLDVYKRQGKACHVVGYATQVGLTQALGLFLELRLK